MRKSFSMLMVALIAVLFCTFPVLAAEPEYPSEKQMVKPIQDAIGHYSGAQTPAEKVGLIASYQSKPSEVSLPSVKMAQDFIIAQNQARPTAYIDRGRYRMFFDFKYDETGLGWYVVSVRFLLLPPQVGDDEIAQARVYPYEAYHNPKVSHRPRLTINNSTSLTLHAQMICTGMPQHSLRDFIDPLYVLEIDRGGQTLILDWYIWQYDGVFYGSFADIENRSVSYEVDKELMQAYGTRYLQKLSFDWEPVIVD